MSMTPAVKSAVESALVAALAAACALWFLVSGANAEVEPIAQITLSAIALGIAAIAHIVFMAIAVKRSGRAFVPWLIALIVLAPLTSVVLIVLFYSSEKPQQQA